MGASGQGLGVEKRTSNFKTAFATQLELLFFDGFYYFIIFDQEVPR